MTLYLSIEQVLYIHALQIRRFGGSAGLRDRGALEAAVARPQATFGGEDLYPELPAKAAALMHSVVTNHPFVDGNKRSGFSVAVLFLELNGYRFEATEADATVRTLALAAGAMKEAAFAAWLKANSRRTRR